MKVPILFFALCIASTAIQAETWRTDKQQSELRFEATYEGEPLAGKFNRFSTTLLTDGKTASPESLQVVVNTASIDFDSDDLREGAISKEWFFVSRFPQAEFGSNEIVQTSPGHYLSKGLLTIKGISRQVVVPFRLDLSHRPALLSGELTLNRGDFNIGEGEWQDGETIGVDVRVFFSIRLMHGQ